jgi:hypothetical protein
MRSKNNMVGLLAGASLVALIGGTALYAQIVTGTQDFSIVVEEANAPDAFTFPPLDAYAGEVAVSDPVTLSNFTGPLPISVSGTGSPEYSLDGGVTFTSASGVVNDGDSLILRVASSSTAGQSRTGTVTIGGQSTTLTVTSAALPGTSILDLTSENTITDAPVSTWFESRFTDRNLTVPLDDTPFSVSSGMEYKLRLVGPSDFASTELNNYVGALSWSTAPQVLAAGSYELLVRSISSDQYETSTTETLTIGPVSKSVNLTTTYDPAEYTPAPFLLSAVTADSESEVTSDPVTVSGLGAGKAALLSVSSAPAGQNPAFSINGGSYSSSARTVENGDVIRFRMNAGFFDGSEVVLTAQAATPSGTPTRSSTWTVTAQAPAAAAVDQFAFNWEYFPQSYFGNFPGSIYESDVVTLSGGTGTRPLRLLNSSGNYNSGTLNRWPALYGTRIYFENTGTTITTSLTNDSNRVSWATLDSNYPNIVTDMGRQIRMKYTPASNSNETYTVVCVAYTCAEHLWTNSATRSDPRAADAFDVADVTGAALSTLYTSDPFTVSWSPRTAGVQPPNIPISISGDATAEYRVNGGAWTTASGWVGSGSTVEMRVTSSAAVGTDVTATLSVGTTTSDYVVRTQDDTTPDAFSLAAVTGSDPNVVVTSAPVTITGISTSVPVSVSGDGSPQLSTDGGTTWDTTGTVAPDGSVLVRLTSASAYETARSATLDVNGVTGSFSVTTGAFSFSVAAKTFVPQNSLISSDPIALPVYLGASSISVSGDGSPEYSVNGGGFTSASGTVSGGDSVVVRLTSGSTEGAESVATLTIGSANAGFSATTVPPDPCTTGPVGTACVDGALFAGVANGERIYINTSTQTNVAFMSSSAQVGYFPGFYDRGIDNQSLTAAQRGDLSGFPAMAHCEGLSTGSRDYYLPSTSELQVIYANRSALSSALILSGSGDQYRSSTVHEDGDYDRMGEVDMGSGLVDPDELYSSTRSVICVSYGPGTTPVDPCAGSPSVGDYCSSDDTIYIGEIGGVARYTTADDSVGKRLQKTSLSGTAGTRSRTDGLANTNAMLADSAAAHPAAAACRALGAEWYLPAIDELQLMRVNTAPRLEPTWSDTGRYWSSTENQFDGRRAERDDPTSNSGADTFKNNSYSVRCVKQ